MTEYYTYTFYKRKHEKNCEQMTTLKTICSKSLLVKEDNRWDNE